MKFTSIGQASALRLIVAGAALVALGSLAAACGSTNAVDPTPVKQFKITPADPGRATATAPAATATPASSGGDASVISIVALDIKFDKDKLSAPAGAITVNLDNKDSGTPHNIHFHKGDKASGDSVGATDLESGPVKQTLKLNLEAGSYYYQCDAHPTMKGILTVS